MFPFRSLPSVSALRCGLGLLLAHAGSSPVANAEGNAVLAQGVLQRVGSSPPASSPGGAKAATTWSVRYRLGPGDKLNFALFGNPDLAKKDVPVSPDGSISFLQAKQVPAEGKTIDELRVAVRERLAPYYRNPRVMVTPAELGSKRYTVLGEVRTNGSFPLTRPTTLLEALARAGGFQLGNLGDDAVPLADLERSFIVRRGERLPADLAALYQRGEFRENIFLEPDDYIFIASRVRNEIYVLGRVERPGVYSIRAGMTATGAIAAAGGFAETAWRNRVLVVRGKMSDPETHVVELHRAFHGRETDFALEPGDLVFVATQPWAYAAQILDAALVAYIDGSVAGLLAEDEVGFSIGPGF